MTLIDKTTYNPNTLHYNLNEKLSEVAPAPAGIKSEKKNKPSSPDRDMVTFSKEVAIAKTREILGLNPTGRLTLSDFKTAAENQGQDVKSMLMSYMEKMDIDKNQKISLSLDAKSNIIIKENFSDKGKLEKTLNEDKKFSLAFNRLSANSEFLDYTKNLQTRTSSLVDYMNSDSDWTRALSLGSEYSSLKSSSNPLETLLGISKKQTPFTFEYGPAGQEG